MTKKKTIIVNEVKAMDIATLIELAMSEPEKIEAMELIEENKPIINNEIKNFIESCKAYVQDDKKFNIFCKSIKFNELDERNKKHGNVTPNPSYADISYAIAYHCKDNNQLAKDKMVKIIKWIYINKLNANDDYASQRVKDIVNDRLKSKWMKRGDIRQSFKDKYESYLKGL